uniref:Thioredoxin domain-containing protein n=1 Tax=Rhodosorus marinus TaxID=101924 RepID=A0A7S3A5T3_9RHOD|mmetsp:Transcript_43732/g.171123  ORF Transcript_43732/g.171123 Transcript_43732/m.171123 type:complete len:158 (+) Transcript_43732:159-632(+)|eukprot:CAMPEP_0113969406 /NCGR_PEP_ID=MMETSP0011_2-20120614/10295_1 /TAXON_ID=101924 /ORGANISM="Rhodosorus marinus" /LENGTH=157 /DNA_ID=CAMNT_0000983051 /DNA_START=94 /DNA_END=567 /DNA_ORIENTATION=- /assembly_acc=CAM_ASM_000156
MSGFVSGFRVSGNGSRRGEIAAAPRSRREVVRAVIAVPSTEDKVWRRSEEPLFPLRTEKDFHAVVDSSQVEDKVVVAVLKRGDASSDIVESHLKNHAKEFANLSFYAVDEENVPSEFAGQTRAPRLMIFSRGKAIEDKRYRMSRARTLRDDLKAHAA